MEPTWHAFSSEHVVRVKRESLLVLGPGPLGNLRDLGPGRLQELPLRRAGGLQHRRHLETDSRVVGLALELRGREF